jgi:hypothetical protein
MKKNFVLSAAAIVMATALVFTACGGKNGGGSSGSGKANPATDFGYDLTADGQGIVIKKYTGGPGKVVIPAKIEDMPVVEIGEEAFNGKTTTFNLGAAMNTGNALNGIGSKENEKAGITSITIPNSVTKIGDEAFANTAITSIVIPDSVTELGEEVFENCALLTEIRLSDNLEYLPNLGGWGKLPALKKSNLPKNLKRINDDSFGAFTYCGELIDLVIPDTLQSLEFGEYNFTWSKAKDGWLRSEEAAHTFKGCSKLPIKTRQALQALGYKGEF